jgi:hypothetical protein
MRRPTRPAQRQAPMIEQLAAMLTVRRQLSEQKVACLLAKFCQM